MRPKYPEIYPEITLGENICRKLKEMYFSDKSWPECYKDVAKKLSELKTKMKQFYNVPSNEQALKILQTFSEKDIQEVFDII